MAGKIMVIKVSRGQVQAVAAKVAKAAQAAGKTTKTVNVKITKK